MPRIAASPSAMVSGSPRQEIRRHHADRLRARRRWRAAPRTRSAPCPRRAPRSRRGPTPSPTGSSGGNQSSSGSCLAGREQPVVGEGIGELLDDRPLDAEMRVAHGMGRIGGLDVLLADVEAAGEGRRGRRSPAPCDGCAGSRTACARESTNAGSARPARRPCAGPGRCPTRSSRRRSPSISTRTFTPRRWASIRA